MPRYVQASLIRGHPGSGLFFSLAWVPAQMAWEGNLIKHVPTNVMWKVTKVYNNITIDSPIYPEHLIREHRKNTGDSNPRKVNNNG